LSRCWESVHPINVDGSGGGWYEGRDTSSQHSQLSSRLPHFSMAPVAPAASAVASSRSRFLSFKAPIPSYHPFDSQLSLSPLASPFPLSLSFSLFFSFLCFIFILFFFLFPLLLETRKNASDSSAFLSLPFTLSLSFSFAKTRERSGVLLPACTHCSLAIFETARS